MIQCLNADLKKLKDEVRLLDEVYLWSSTELCPVTGCKQAGLGNSKLLRMDWESKADERKEERKASPPQWTRASCYRASRRNFSSCRSKLRNEETIADDLFKRLCCYYSKFKQNFWAIFLKLFHDTFEQRLHITFLSQLRDTFKQRLRRKMRK